MNEKALREKLQPIWQGSKFCPDKEKKFCRKPSCDDCIWDYVLVQLQQRQKPLDDRELEEAVDEILAGVHGVETSFNPECIVNYLTSAEKSTLKNQILTLFPRRLYGQASVPNYGPLDDVGEQKEIKDIKTTKFFGAEIQEYKVVDKQDDKELREEIARLVYFDCTDCPYISEGDCVSPKSCKFVTEKADQILALLQPKIEEARRQERERIKKFFLEDAHIWNWALSDEALDWLQKFSWKEMEKILGQALKREE